jgi:hypothetical protein
LSLSWAAQALFGDNHGLTSRRNVSWVAGAHRIILYVRAILIHFDLDDFAVVLILRGVWPCSVVFCTMGVTDLRERGWRMEAPQARYRCPRLRVKAFYRTRCMWTRRPVMYDISWRWCDVGPPRPVVYRSHRSETPAENSLPPYSMLILQDTCEIYTSSKRHPASTFKSITSSAVKVNS